MAETKTVAQFAPQGSEADKLLAYPFEVPTHSYLTAGEIVTELPDSFAEFVAQTDELLSAQGLPTMAERIPVIEYGSNASPYQSSEKMGKFGPESLQTELQTVPKIMATVQGAEIVWHGKPGQKGSAFAELFKDETTDSAESPCFVAFMDEKQLAVMHTTEGVTYEAVWLDTHVGSDGTPMKALAYVAQKSSVLVKDGQPVRVQRPGGVAAEGGLGAEEAVNYILESAGDTIGTANARELIESAAKVDLAGKKALQAPVAAKLRKQGKSKTFSFPKEPGMAVGRADFNSIKPSGDHDTLRLMEEVVADLRPTAEQLATKAAEFEAKGANPKTALKKARTALDIAEALRKRATEELGIPIVKTEGGQK